ncbi:MAG: hypothetical protein R2739_06260 [Chitinophagales bacterium]|nr:hypothetical protein [Bacteroidota bacterium]
MKRFRKLILASACIFLLGATTACARKNASGCPAWSKNQTEHPVKKSV